MPDRSGERWVDRPADAGAAADHARSQQQRKGRHQQPEADVVHPRERHVRRTDHQRHKPVAKTAYHRRHDHEKHHDQAMRGYDDVIELMVLDEGVPGMHQLDPRGDREGAADHSGDDGERQVKGADVLVVGRAQPAGKKAWDVAMTIGLVAMLVGEVGRMLVSHSWFLRSQLPSGARRGPSGGRGAAATRSASSPLSRRANFFLASSTQRWNASFATASTLIGMKAWLMPQIWLHCP